MARREFDYPTRFRCCAPARRPNSREVRQRTGIRSIARSGPTSPPRILRSRDAEVGLDLKRWGRDSHTQEVAYAIGRDLAGARTQGIRNVPTLVAEGRYVPLGEDVLLEHGERHKPLLTRSGLPGRPVEPVEEIPADFVLLGH